MPQFLILAEDYKDADALSRRLAVREDHLKRMRIEKAAGRFIIGGAKLNEEGSMYASTLIVNLESESSVKEWLKDDPCVTGKVWEHIDIFPFRVAEV